MGTGFPQKMRPSVSGFRGGRLTAQDDPALNREIGVRVPVAAPNVGERSMSVRAPHLASFGLGHRLLRASHIGLGAALARPAKVRPDQPQADVCGPRIRGDGAERANTPPAGSLLLDGVEHASCADRLRTALVDPDSLIVVAIAMSAIARLTRPDTGKGLGPRRPRRLRRLGGLCRPAFLLGARRFIALRWVGRLPTRRSNAFSVERVCRRQGRRRVFDPGVQSWPQWRWHWRWRRRHAGARRRDARFRGQSETLRGAGAARNAAALRRLSWLDETWRLNGRGIRARRRGRWRSVRLRRSHAE